MRRKNKRNKHARENFWPNTSGPDDMSEKTQNQKLPLRCNNKEQNGTFTQDDGRNSCPPNSLFIYMEGNRHAHWQLNWRIQKLSSSRNKDFHLPYANYLLKFFFHRADHVTVKIIFWCKVVVLPWIRQTKTINSKLVVTNSRINEPYNLKCLNSKTNKHRMGHKWITGSRIQWIYLVWRQWYYLTSSYQRSKLRSPTIRIWS